MAEKSFVLVSLKEQKAKKLTQTLSNETCRQILEYLSNIKEATETQISKDLNIPMSTIHYNLKQLSENKLVSTDEFHYSKKGKEVIHYKIANKYIVIAPEDADESFLDKLKSMLPAYIAVVTISLVTYITPKIMALLGEVREIGASTTFSAASKAMADEAATPVLTNTLGETAVREATHTAVSTTPIQPGIALWFFLGGIVGLTTYLLWEFVKEKRKTPSQ